MRGTDPDEVHRSEGVSRSLRVFLSFFVVSSLVPTAVLGQDLPSPGERVRVWGPNTAMNLLVGEVRVCEFSAVRGDTLVFDMSNGEQIAIPQHRIRRLDVRRHRTQGEGTRFGAIVGLGVGAAAGVLLSSQSDTELSAGIILYASTVFGGIGAGVGALIGRVHPGERWTEVQLGRDPDVSDRAEATNRVEH